MAYSISVVIRTKNESKYLGKVLKRLKEQQYAGPVEIILVDSGSTDDTVSIAEGFGCRIVCMKPEEFSFGRALNVGIERAAGEIIINLSGHSAPENTDYFSRMVEPFTDGSVAATFGRDIPWPEACPSHARDIYDHFPEDGPDGNKFSNANAALRKNIWEKIKFDENIPAAEDLLWAKQVMNSGYTINYIPAAKVYHSHTPSLKYICRRAYVESKSLNSFLETKHHFGIYRFVRFLLSHSIKDMIFSIRKKYSLFWLFHIPLYRFSQGMGFIKGFKEGSQIYIEVLSEIEEYSFQTNQSKDKKKVLLVTQCFFPESIGGVEYYTLNLAMNLAAKGWDAKIVSAFKDLSQKRYKVIESQFNGIKVIKINNPSELYTKFTDYFIDHTIENIFKKIIKAEGPDLIHFQHTACLSTRLPEISRQMNIPSIFTLHDYWYICFRSQLIRPSEGICPGPSEGLYCASCFDPAQPNVAAVPKFPVIAKILQVPFVRILNIKAWLSPKLKQRIKKLLYKQPETVRSESNSSDFYFPTPEFCKILEHSFRIQFMKRQLTFPAVVISPSIYLKKRYEKDGFREITYIPHGFEPQEKITNIPFNGKLVIAYLSNIIPFKGADVLLKELKHVKEKQKVRILIYGRVLDGIYQKKLEDLAREYPDVDISFLRPYKGKDEMKQILANIHVVVFPSLWEENHPLVIREALQYGIPVISSCLGGAQEAIEEGINGLTFDPYKEGDLAAQINLIFEQPGLLEKITEGARNTRIESMDDHTEKIMRIYDDAIRTIAL